MNNVQKMALDAIPAIIVYIALFFSSDLEAWSILGVSLFVFLGFRFLNVLGDRIEIRHIIVLIAVLQWVIGPLLTYLFFPQDEIFYMAVSKVEYMNYAMPATLAFVSGLFIPLFRRPTKNDYALSHSRRLLSVYPNLDIILIITGFIALFIGPYMPGSLSFFVFLISEVRFVGLYFLILNKQRRFQWLIFSATIISFLSASMLRAMFHGIIIWFTFMLLILAFIYKPNYWVKLGGAILLFAFIFIIQSVKTEFRSEDERSIERFSEMAVEKAEDDHYFHRNNLEGFVMRINQGWIIARIMYYTPVYEPFAEGETISRGIANLLPRLVYDDKVEAGGHVYFERFTGTELVYGTSMNLSILGESYANFGVEGGAVFMFVFGLFLNFFLYLVFRISLRHPTVVFFIPLMFLEVIKAETDFASVLNYLIKAAFTVFLIYWVFRRVYGMQI